MINSYGLSFVAKIQQMSFNQKAILVGSATALAVSYVGPSIILGTLGVSGVAAVGATLAAGYLGYTIQRSRAERKAAELLWISDRRELEASPFRLLVREMKQIESYVEDHLPGWRASLPESGSITCKKSKELPRTLRIFKEAGEPVVMVLCNRKAGTRLVGQGAVKLVKLAFQLSTKEPFARCIEKDEINPIDFDTQLEIGRLVGGKPGMAPKPIGVNTYKKPNVRYEKREYFQPLRLGDLTEAYLTLTAEDCRSVAIQLVKALKTLENEGLFYGDLYLPNVLYYREKDLSIKVELGDFNYAGRGKELEPDTVLLSNLISGSLCRNPSVKKCLDTYQFLQRLARDLKTKKASEIDLPLLDSRS